MASPYVRVTKDGRIVNQDEYFGDKNASDTNISKLRNKILQSNKDINATGSME